MTVTHIYMNNVVEKVLRYKYTLYKRENLDLHFLEINFERILFYSTLTL